MPRFEVAYTVDDDLRTELVEAADPVDAARLFKERNQDEKALILCVVRQSILACSLGRQCPRAGQFSAESSLPFRSFPVLSTP